MQKRIVLAGAGTGGHLFPLITVVKNLRKNHSREQTFEFLFIGPKGKLEDKLMTENAILQKNIQCGKFRRYFSLWYLVDIFKLPVGFVQSLWHLFKFMPDAVFAKGGFASVPVVLAAWIYRIPVIVHESDAVPGMANKLIGSIAKKIVLNFERAKIYFNPEKVTLAGLPVKEEAIGGSLEGGRNFLDIRKEVKPVILFLGGSQGAKRINEKIISIIHHLVKKYQIIHQTGVDHYDDIVSQAEGAGYKIEHSDYYPVAFIGEELRDLLALADVVVSRAGATSISEIAANGKPAILIPIKNSANDHQRINAYELSKARAAVVIEEQNFTRGILLHYLDEMCGDEKFKSTLSENIKKFYHPDSAEKISRMILELV